ncbi:hypothetical protein SuNHUV7_38120 (plasmid) [Pseudoseohaeicola sp. NH-UV-7]|uniref:capsule biosynthesis protein n=1 Tax=Sulfitobacter sp. TBRI5 TaxID=2989732 RepID=UPI003A74070F
MSNPSLLLQPTDHGPLAFPARHVVRPLARAGRMRRRHWAILVSFVLLVCIPAGLVAAYLYGRAADQYASTVGFSVRSETPAPPATLLGGLADLPSQTASDTDILYAYLGSQDLVRKLDEAVDLRTIWSRVSHEKDPVFALDPRGTIEDVVAHWARMVDLVYDPASGLIDVHVLAFTPDDAQNVTLAVLAACEDLINVLSAQAREDAIKHARGELGTAAARLKQARLDLTAFRNRTQIVDPALDTRNQMGLMITLQEQLATAIIDVDLLQGTTGQDDPRILRAQRRIDVIEKSIATERRKLGLGGSDPGKTVFATLIGEYEGLIVDREFAESAYLAALASYDSARADARKQSRYLAAHIRPTRAEKAEYPARLKWFLPCSTAFFLLWAVLCLVGYGLYDRR